MTRKMWRKSIPYGGNDDEMFQRDRKRRPLRLVHSVQVRGQ